MTDPTWSMKPLVDLCKRPDGIRCGPFGTQLSRDEFRKAGVPLWGIKHVNANFQFATDEFIEEATAGRLAQYDLIPGDLVMTRKGTIGNCAVYPEAFPLGIMHSDLLRLRLDLGEADPSFLVHQLHHSSDVHRQLASISGGAVMPGINVGRLKKLIVRVPPLAEQKRIAGILDAADALRARRREALAQLDTLLQSTFLDMFGDPTTNPMGWKTSALRQVTDEIYRYPTYFGIVYENDGVPEIRGELIGKHGRLDIDRGNLRFIAQSTSDRFPRTQLAPGDLVMSVRGTIGKIGIVPDELVNANITANLIRISPIRSIMEPVFLLHVGLGPYFISKLSEVSSSTTIKTIKARDLAAISIPLPPLDLQRRFAAIVKSIQQQKASQRAHLAELDNLFASLQSRAFRGDL